MSLLSIRGLEVCYGGVKALHCIDLTVEEGQTMLLVGANGAGKTSLISSVCGLVPASSGSIVFGGRDVTGLTCVSRARLGIGYSPEGRRVFGSLNVEDNVLCGGARVAASERDQNFAWICSTFPLIADRARQPAGELSGGEQQVVALARAVCARPRLLLLDEPFLGLAPVWITRISEAIRSLQQRGTTILMTEQMARPALKVATDVAMIRNGELRKVGRVQEMRDLALADEYL